MKIIKEQVAKIIAMSFSSENEQHESQNGTHFGCKNIVRNIQFDDYWNQQENGSDVHIVDGSVTDVDPDSADEENDNDYDDANEFQYQDNDNRIDFGNLESNHVQMRMGSEKYFTMNVCPTILSNENDPTSDKYNMAMERNEHDSTNESEIPFISKLTELEKNSIFNDNHPDGKTIEEEQKFTFWMNKLQEASRRQTEIKQKQEFEDKNDFTDVSSELDERTFDSEGKFAYWYNKLENASRIVYKKKRKHELDEGIIIKAGSSFASEYEIVGNIRESQSDPLKLFVTIRKRCSQPKRVRTSMTSLSGVNSPIENNTKVNKKANESISKVIDFKTSQSFGNDQSTRRQINYEPYQQKSGCRIFDDLPDEISLHQRYFPREPMRPPITIHPLHHALPPTLQHLSPDTKVDIFDRKTCKILKGEDGICVKDLPTVLRYHAEYEPIIPHQETKRGKSINHSIRRRGRSSGNVCVSSAVNPQRRTRSKMSIGKRVMVKSGQYIGLIGKICSVLPGKWVMVSGLNRDNHDVILNISQLELLPPHKLEQVVEDLQKRTKLTSKKVIVDYFQKLNDMIEEYWSLQHSSLNIISDERNEKVQSQMDVQQCQPECQLRECS